MNEGARLTPLAPMDDYRRDGMPVEIARRLLNYLLEGNVEPGHKIPSERRLAAELGVGRSIVREALKSLTLLGIIDVRQGDGTYLRRMDSELLAESIEWGLLLGQPRIKDMIEARRYLEVILAELAAVRRSQTDLDVLSGILEEMRASVDDPERYVAADIAFHLRIAEASGNTSLAGVMSSIRSLLQVWIARVTGEGGANAESSSEHEAVFVAIVNGDRNAARNAMQKHMERAYDRLADTLPFDLGPWI